MKNKLFTILALVISLNIFAQYDVDINKTKRVTGKERRNNEQQKREETGGCKFIPFHDYAVGMKFYFPIDNSKLRFDEYGYDKYYSVEQIKKNKFQINKIKYKNISGKLFEIIKIEERKPGYREDTYITLKQVDSSFTIEHKSMFDRIFLKNQWEKDETDGQVSVLPDAIYTGEIDSFKEKFLNKELYSKVLVKGKRYQKVKIIEVGAGTENQPIRAVVINEKGDKEQIDFCTCGTNVSSVYLYSNTMNNYFSTENPKDKFKGKDENWDLICEKKLKIGFTEDELRWSWGGPDSINETTVSGKQHKQFVYSNQYVYLENGIVTSFQSSK